MRIPIDTGEAPSPVAPYSSGVEAGKMIYLSGQLGLDAHTGKLVDGGVKAQAERALQNISTLAFAAGCSMKDVVKTTVFMTDISEFGTVNDLYTAAFKDPRPARSVVEVSALPLGALIEIEAILYRGTGD